MLLLLLLTHCCPRLSVQKFKEYLNGSNLIIKLQAKHDLLKQTLGEGEDLYSSSSVSVRRASDSVLHPAVVILLRLQP